MFDYKLVVNKLSEILSLVKEELSETQVGFIRSYINAGEWNLALETLCEILNEEELILNHEVNKRLQEVSIMLNIKLEMTLETKPN